MKFYNMLARADLKGSSKYPDIKGTVWFQDVPLGTNVCAYVKGLPPYQPAHDNEAPIGPFGFHLHEFGNCSIGDEENPFQDAGGHYNPTNEPHGNHAGDFPVLFSNAGISKMCFFTDKFHVEDIIQRSVIIHENPDDYRSQPAGDAGKRIACGIVHSITPYNFYPIFFH
ncbi:superoxide dismutase family protein [Vallitalea okinawensis]|uniref:superoxide dismutase family protein n=1 Tax=Vallitalea okinawensis TaxID=2078660 RepID=UPI000CFD2A4A|nr:superoxide dismutase family protein [Vallitalea okinawensis]